MVVCTNDPWRPTRRSQVQDSPSPPRPAQSGKQVISPSRTSEIPSRGCGSPPWRADSLAWRVRVTASLDPLFYAHGWPQAAELAETGPVAAETILSEPQAQANEPVPQRGTSAPAKTRIERARTCRLRMILGAQPAQQKRRDPTEAGSLTSRLFGSSHKGVTAVRQHSDGQGPKEPNSTHTGRLLHQAHVAEPPIRRGR